MNENPIVYIVDDDPSIRKSLKRLIGSTGLQVQVFPSAREFLQIGLPDQPSCLVLDVKLPDVSGPELQQQFFQESNPIPIVFITGHGDLPMAVRAMKRGAIDFLSKPYDETDLLAAVNSGLDKSRSYLAKSFEKKSIDLRLQQLTPREFEIMTYVIGGFLNKQIAYYLGITEKTVKVHRARVMSKLQANSVAELVRFTAKVNILPVTTPSGA
jgi:FixJ family two-component response regulator